MAKIMFLFQITNLFTKKQTGTLDRSCHSGYETCMPENKKRVLRKQNAYPRTRREGG